VNGSLRPGSSEFGDRSALVFDGDPQIVELRIALVLYGGVSLAVYMHGITKELQSLLSASRAFETALARAGDRQPTADGLLLKSGTEWTYFDQLVQLWRAGVPVSATVDVIAGTSAGGINGICLAKAIVCNTSQNELTRLWMDKGDIGHLLRYGFLGRHLGEALTALALPVRADHPGWSPLKGAEMCRWLYAAMASMDAHSGVGTLLPSGGTLDLYVTTTDLRGTDQVLALGAGGALHEHTYQRIFRFSYRPDGGSACGLTASLVPADTIGDGFAGALAYAARATSSFPGAFPPNRGESTRL
jgi:patatin-related protein